MENLNARQFFSAGTFWNSAHSWSAIILYSFFFFPTSTQLTVFKKNVDITTCTFFFLSHIWKSRKLSYNLTFFSKMPVKSVVILYEFSFFYSLKSIFLGTQLKFPHTLRVYQASLIWSCPISIVFKILQIVNSALYEIMGEILYPEYSTNLCVCACVRV